MKTLLFLLLPILSFSQVKPNVTLNSTNVEAIYDKLIQYEMCQEDLAASKEIATSLMGIVEELRTAIEKATKELRTLKTEKAETYAQIETLTIEKTVLENKKHKPFGIGIIAGYGIGLRGEVKSVPFIGVGVSFNLIRF